MRLLISLLILAACLGGKLRAQLAPGDWAFHSAFRAGNTSVLVPTGGKVFFLSGINLFSYSPSTEELVSYTRASGLSDVSMEQLVYNPERDFMLAVYANSNLDFIYPDGTIVNLSAIKDASISGDRKVNCVVFKDKRAFISTDFGLVVVDTDSHRVLESAQYRGGTDSQGHPLPSGGPERMVAVGDKLIAQFDGKLYVSYPDDKTHSYREPEKFIYAGVCNLFPLLPYKDSAIITSRYVNGTVRTPVVIDLPIQTTSSGTVVTRPLSGDIFGSPGLWSDGGDVYGILGDGTNTVVKITSSGEERGVRMPAEALSSIVSLASTGSLKETWTASLSGLSRYNLASSEPRLEFGPFMPALPSVTYVSMIVPTADGKGMFVGTRASSQILTATGACEPFDTRTVKLIGDRSPGFLDKITDQHVANHTPVNPGVYTMYNGTGSANSTFAASHYGNIIPATECVAENPMVPGDLWIGTYNEGLYRVRGGVVDGVFAASPLNDRFVSSVDNMPNPAYISNQVHGVLFDPEGNLWALVNGNNNTTYAGEPQLMILPAALAAGPASAIKRSDWITSGAADLTLKPVFVLYDGGMTMLPRSNSIAVRGNTNLGGLGIYRHKGTYTNTSDDSFTGFNQVYDQDGNIIPMTGIGALAEDPQGRLVVGCREGFFYIANPATFDPARDRVRRFKVARNDGTGTADYLLDGVVISGIDFDPSGRMWVSTEGSGISVISPEYDEVLEVFNTDNSPLPTNNISTIRIDRTSNKVYFGSVAGLGEYSSDQSPAMEDYDSARAYPNPVAPDFRGSVTIDGLMGESLVKIMDAMGNLVYAGTSQGGTMSWNLRDINGARVKSGVYYVLASQNVDDSGPKGKVACKILVMR